MTSSGLTQSEHSERAAANLRTVERDWRCMYPNERRERNQIYTLLSISNSANEQEEKSLECVNGTGWEEAERGWGRATPFACCKIQTSKKPTSKIVSNISHTSMDPASNTNLTWITKCARDHANKYCKFTEGETVSSCKKLEASCMKPDNCIPVMTAHVEGERINSKLNSIQTFLGEKKTLPIKQYEIKCSEGHTKPPVLNCHKIQLPREINCNPPSNPNCLTLNALLVLKADGKRIINLHLEPFSKNETIAVKTSKKGSGTVTETASHRRNYRTKKEKQKRKKNISMINNIVTKQIKNPVPPFVPLMLRNTLSSL